MLFSLFIVILSGKWHLRNRPGIGSHSFLAICLFLGGGGGLSRFLMTISLTCSISYSLSYTGFTPCYHHRLLERDWCGCMCSFRFSVVAFFSACAYLSFSYAWYMHQAVSGILFSQYPIHFCSLLLPNNANTLLKHSPLQWFWWLTPSPFSITTLTPHHSHPLLPSPPSRFPLLSNESPKYPR